MASAEHPALLNQIEEMDSQYREAITDLALTMVCSAPPPAKPTSVSELWATFCRRKDPEVLPRQRER